jgi:hypothetical protein
VSRDYAPFTSAEQLLRAFHDAEASVIHEFFHPSSDIPKLHEQVEGTAANLNIGWTGCDCLDSEGFTPWQTPSAPPRA